MNNPNSPKKFSLTKAFAAVAVGLALYGGYNLIQKQDAEIKADAKNAVEQSQRVPYTQFVDEAQKGMINRIEILPNGGLVGTAPGLPPVLSQQLPDDNIAARLENQIRDHKIEINVVPSQQMRAQSGSSGGGSGGGGLGNIFLTAVIFGGVIIGLQMLVSKFRGGQGGGGANMSNIGKSKARMVDPAHNNVTFDDVAGCDEAKEEVKEIVDFLREPGRFSKLGAKIPKGGLLVGPPGTGKTMLAKAVAKEAKVPFFTISGSDFVEMFVGVGAARVRDMFEVAKKHAPCIIFIDEIDAVGGKRGGDGGGGNSEREQTLNQILVEMDGVEGETGVVIFGATNRPEMLDPALLRPGRFDRQVYVTLPDIKGREQILRSYARKVPLSPDVDLRVVARGAPGMSGADLANLVNEAALMAGRRKATMIEPKDFDTAKDKIMMGTERRTAVMPEHEVRNTAYHETGHMLMNKKLPQHLVDPFYKMSVMPRGRTLGVSMSLPDEDRYSASRARLKAEMVHLMGGRMAEIKQFGWENVTGGASNDIERATDIARNMVMKYGMSEILGAQRFVTGEGMSMLGGGGTRMQPIADDTMRLIDEEVKVLLAEAEKDAARILDDNEEVFEKVSQALLKWETLTNAHVEAIFRGEDIDEVMKKEDQIERQHRMAKNLEPAPDRANDNEPKPPNTDRFTM